MAASRGLKPSTQVKYVPFNGGLDIVTPAQSVDPGFALALVNFEPFYNGGYRRVDGYERYDGRAAPSAAVCNGATISDMTGIIFGTGTNAFGTGSISGAKAQFVQGVSVAGTNYVAMTAGGTQMIMGDRIIQGTTTNLGTLTSVPVSSFAPPGTGTSGYTYQAEFLANAQNYYRQKILPPPGIGNPLGVWRNGTTAYAVRANFAGTGTLYALLSKTTGTAGWGTAGVSYVSTMYYTGTNTALAAGSVVTGATSSAFGTVYQSISHSPSQGYLALTGVGGTGTFGTSELLKIGTATWGTSASACTAFGLNNGAGFYRWKNANFFASSATYYTYGCNGLDPAFQIDSNNVVMPILMALTPLPNQPGSNAPFLIEVYQNMLALAFTGGVFQLSVPGLPLTFNGFLGASQFGMGAELTGMFSIVGPALAITTQRNTQVLTGNTAQTFALGVAAEKAGSVPFGCVSLDTVYALGNLGITSLSRTQSYGNFVGATISQLVQPLVAALRSQLSDVSISRAANQARFYFTDGSVLIVYIPGLGQQNKAWTAIETGVTAQFGYANYPQPVTNICNSEDQNGAEVAYFTSAGYSYIYQDRSGSSWDGVAVPSYARLAFNNIGSPGMRKYFRRGDLDINTAAQVLLQFAPDFSYTTETVSSAVPALTAAAVPTVTAADISRQNVFAVLPDWNEPNWTAFNWDAQSLSSARAELNGTGQSMSLLVFHISIVDKPFVLQGINLHFDPRRNQR